MKKEILAAAAVFFVIALIIYSPCLQAPRYSDDFTIVPEGKFIEDLTKIWTTSYQRDMFYRPVDDTITIFILHFWGWNTLPVHLLSILIHIYLVTFSYYAMVKLKYTRAEALTGALFILAAQVNVFSVGSNDTLSSTLASSACLTALWFLYLSIRDDNSKIKLKFYFISLFLLLFSLFTKELGAAFFPFLIVLMLYKNSFFTQFSFQKIKRSILVSLPFIAIFIVYYIIRSIIVPFDPAGGEDNYNFRFGLNIPKNLGMLLFAVFLPLSSVRTFEAVMLKDYKFLAAALSLTALFAGTVFWGIWRSKKTKEAALWICFLLAGLFIYLLINHVNEHYTYISMPFIALIIGIGLGYFINNLKGKSRTVFIILFSAFLIFNCFMVMEKAAQINESGMRADMLFRQVIKFTPRVQHNGTLVLVNPPDMPFKYSVFRLPGFETLRYTHFYIYKLAGRKDFKVEVINWNDIEKWKTPGSLLLGLQDENVVILE